MYRDEYGGHPFCTVILSEEDGDIMFTYSEDATDYTIKPKAMQ
jgi:hypothetical protein